MQHNGFRRALGASLFIGSLLWGAQAGAWGQLGHAVVADIAEAQLTPAAKAEADRLLALVRQQHLSAVASWADNLRNMPDFQALWEQTRAQHYINYKTDDCTCQAPRDCPDGQCVVAAIERNAALLADPKANDNQKVMALMFVVHFVGDIHQPLHNSYRLDKGGNDFPVVVGGRDYNLHSVWDSYLLASRRLDQAAYTAKLSEDLPKPEVGTPASWSGSPAPSSVTTTCTRRPAARRPSSLMPSSSRRARSGPVVAPRGVTRMARQGATRTPWIVVT